LCVPLMAHGQVSGVIQLINKLNGEFNERDLQLLRILAALGSLVEIANAWLCERNLGS
jgi:GAF domain-containing protein